MQVDRDHRGVSIRGGTVLWQDRLVERDLVCLDGTIVEHDAGSTLVDATGCLVLPGIIDLHGDAFERSMMPRGGVPIDLDIAFTDNDHQLLAAGITTFFLSVTDSWEPGLRSRETLRKLIRHLDAWRSPVEVRLHVRHERCAVDAIDELEHWIGAGTVSMLSFNDHTPGGIASVTGISAKQVERSGVSAQHLEALQDTAVAHRELGLAQEANLASIASEIGCPLASHDSSSAADYERDVDLGVAIAEFPTSLDLARSYREAGIAVLSGAPNLVRGRSHAGNVSVREAVSAGAVDALCSDYHYPSLLQAPFVLERLGLPLAEAWELVAAKPATASGLLDRGVLDVGKRADVIIVEPSERGPARVRAVVVEGKVAATFP